MKLSLNEWLCHMLRCPSQCYYRTQKDGIDYVLYLRWRWDDPWQGHIFKGYVENDPFIGGTNEEWSNDLFASNHVQYSHDEVELAKTKLIELFGGVR